MSSSFCSRFQEFVSTSIFRVPKPVVLPIDQEISAKIREYSESEDAELDHKIESLVKSIKSVSERPVRLEYLDHLTNPLRFFKKKAYATLLKKRILLLEEGRKFLNPSLEILTKSLVKK